MGCRVHALPCLGVSCVDWGCCCGTFARTSRGSCSSWESHTARSAGLFEGGGAGDSARCRSGMLPGVRESRRGRRSWRGQGGRSGVEEGWAWEDKGETRHWVRVKRRTLQDIRLGIALRRKG